MLQVFIWQIARTIEKCIHRTTARVPTNNDAFNSKDADCVFDGGSNARTFPISWDHVADVPDFEQVSGSGACELVWKHTGVTACNEHFLWNLAIPCKGGQGRPKLVRVVFLVISNTFNEVFGPVSSAVPQEHFATSRCWEFLAKAWLALLSFRVPFFMELIEGHAAARLFMALDPVIEDLVSGVVHVVDCKNNMDILALFDISKAAAKLWHGCKCHRAIDHHIDMVFVRCNLYRNVGKTAQTHQDSENDAHDDTVEEVGEHDSKHGNDVNAKLTILSKLTHVVNIDKIDTRIDQETSEDRAWNQLNPGCC